jgi:hypothetical protein
MRHRKDSRDEKDQLLAEYLTVAFRHAFHTRRRMGFQEDRPPDGM